MDTIAVYTKYECVQCSATFRALERAGIKETAATSPKTLCLMRHTDSGEYLQVPVVVTPDTHFSGFRPDRIRALTAA